MNRTAGCSWITPPWQAPSQKAPDLPTHKVTRLPPDRHLGDPQEKRLKPSPDGSALYDCWASPVPGASSPYLLTPGEPFLSSRSTRRLFHEQTDHRMIRHGSYQALNPPLPIPCACWLIPCRTFSVRLPNPHWIRSSWCGHDHLMAVYLTEAFLKPRMVKQNLDRMSVLNQDRERSHSLQYRVW